MVSGDRFGEEDGCRLGEFCGRLSGEVGDSLFFSLLSVLSDVGMAQKVVLQAVGYDCPLCNNRYVAIGYWRLVMGNGRKKGFNLGLEQGVVGAAENDSVNQWIASEEFGEVFLNEIISTRMQMFT